jgi:hypothetical protein
LRLQVLEQIIDGRLALERQELPPPYVCHLPPKRSARLVAELKSIGVPFGLPLSGGVPDPKDDYYAWRYLGVVLEDVHVYAREA